jgi:polysaccharide deacetylase family protein (PEP-CTERM system associated)
MIATTNGAIVNALTVDVEDYYQVQSFAIDPRRWDDYESRVVANTHRVLRLFDEHQVRATFFILGWVAERFPRLVRDIHASGHEIGCHSHRHRLIYEMTPDEFADDLARATSAVGTVTGEPVVAFRAPTFSITQKSLWALDVLIEQGYRYDSSVFPVYHDNYGIPGAPRFPYRIAKGDATGGGEKGTGAFCAEHPQGLAGKRCLSPLLAPGLVEFPPSVYRFLGYNLPVSGGGYFRLYPTGLSTYCLRRINRRHGQPFMFYFHPWELDPDQPRLPGSLKSRFRHYQNLARTETKLRRLLATFPFGPMSQSLAASRGRRDNEESGAPDAVAAKPVASSRNER